LRLRPGRHRQPQRGLPARLRRLLPVRGAARARDARLARTRLASMTRPAVLFAVQVVTVAAILGCLLALATLHPFRLDLTPSRSFTLSPHTPEILARLNSDVHLTAFYSNPSPPRRPH